MLKDFCHEKLGGQSPLHLLEEKVWSANWRRWDIKEISAQELILAEDELGVEDLLFLGSLYSGYELNLERMPPQGTEVTIMI